MNCACQARHSAGCGVVLENSFVYGAIKDLVDVPQLGKGSGVILLFDGLSDLFDQGLYPGFDLLISCPSL